MAKIVLQVGADFGTVGKQITDLKKRISGLADSFGKIKANKDLTDQIKALTQWNKSLADAVKKTTDVTNKKALADEKLAQQQAKTAKETAKYYQEEEKLNREKIKSAEATGKVLVQEEKVEQAKIKTALAEKKLADAYADTTKEVEDQNEKTKNLVDTLMQWSVTSKLIHSGLRLLKSAVKDVNETLADTEKRIIAIQRVLPEGSVSDKDLSNRLYDLAIEYGQSFANVSDIATNFARTGLSYADTIDATRAALLALNVAELDSTQATDGLIAVMAQFELQASDLENVIDKLNKTADRFPVTTEKLMSALQRMGSSASLAGLGLDETIGIATALSKATGRSGANIGTAANALIQYSTKASALNIYSQLSPEVARIVDQYKIGAANVLDIWQALSKEINNLTYEQSEKLDVLADYFTTGDGSGLKEELESELGDIFNDITGVFSTANTFRKNYFVALLKEMGTVEEAAETARDAMGYSIAENEKEMQTYERRVAALEAHWHKLANDEEGWLKFRKGMVELGDLLLTVMEWTGGLRTAVLGLGTVIGLTFGSKVVAQIRGVISAIRTMTTETEVATVATETLSFAWQGVFAIIGLIITAISALAGAIEKYNKQLKEQRQASIDTYLANQKNAQELARLQEKLTSLDKKSDEYYEIESQIVSLLGDKATYLSDVAKKTDEYTEAVENLTEAQLLALELEKRKAQEASAAKMREQDIGTKVGSAYNRNYLEAYSGVLSGYDDILGFYTNGTSASQIDLGFDLSGTAEAARANYNRAIELLDSITRARNKAGRNNDTEAVAVLEDLFTLINGYVAARKGIIDEYDALFNVEKQSTEQTNTALEEQERTLENIGSQYSKIAEEISGLLSSNQKVNEELEKQKALEEAIAKAKAEYIRDSFETYLAGLETENTISEKQQSIDEARKKVEEARLAVAEKRQAVKEAEYNLQKAQDDLEYAKRNRSERVFNAETGMWEYQANKKSVADAQEKVRAATEKVEDAVKNVDTSIKAVETAEKNVQKAVDALKDYLQKQAISEIKTAINNGNISNEKVKEILVKWFGEDGGGTWGTGIQNAIATAIAGSGAAAASNSAVISAKEALATHIQDKFYTDVMSLFTAGGTVSKGDVDALIEKYRALGVSADAIAAIKKTVNNVGNLDMWGNWSPASNGIRSYANKGIITGSGWGTSPVTPPVVAGGNTSNDNRTYTVNGVPIPAQAARSMTIEELFSNFELVR